MDSSMPIGIFDSGVGGLTVAKHVRSMLPGEEIIYFGDTARLPYGNKQPRTIAQCAKEILKFLEQHHVKAAIAACNTICATALPEIRVGVDFPIFGMIEPVCQFVAKETAHSKIGVLGTAATIKSQTYQQIIQGINPQSIVLGQACPLFVPLVEEGLGKTNIALVTAEHYLDGFVQKDMDCLILGCTHYPFMAEAISKAAKQIRLIDPAETAVTKMKEYLSVHHMMRTKEGARHRFYLSAENEAFSLLCQEALGITYQAEITGLGK